MERWEWLIEGETGIFQDPALGCFTEDPIALVHFAKIGRTDTVLDLGTGNGVMCLYAMARYGGTYTGIDVDEAQIALARRSAKRNGQAIRFLALRAEDAPDALGHGAFSRILMNPTLLSDWLHAAFLLLKNGGTVTLCYPAEQLAALFRALDDNRLAPKRMQLTFCGQRARLALVEAKKLGKDGLAITAVHRSGSGDRPPLPGTPTQRLV